MSLQELGNLYLEMTTPNLPENGRGVKPPVETTDSLRYKGVFGAGDSPPNILSTSMASGQNPQEQEEDALVSKNMVLNLIEKHINALDHVNRLDESGIFHLTKLKSDVNKL